RQRTGVAVTQTTARLDERLSTRRRLLFRSTKPGGARLIRIGSPRPAPLCRSTKPGGARLIRIASRPLQRYLGVGGAMTDSSAELIEDELTPRARRRLMSLLFSRAPRAIDMGFLRVPIGASDFTATGIPYTYDDLPPGEADPGLGHFTIAHDR